MVNLIWCFLCYEPIQTQNSLGKSSLSLSDGKLYQLLFYTTSFNKLLLKNFFHQLCTKYIIATEFLLATERTALKALFWFQRTVSKLFYYWQSTQDCWDGVYPIETHVWEEEKRGGREKWMEVWRERALLSMCLSPI